MRRRVRPRRRPATAWRPSRAAARRRSRPSATIGVEAVGEEALVAVARPHLPRHDDRGVAPAGRPVMNWAIGLSWVAGAWGSGRMLGTRPSAHWSSARSRSHLAREPGHVVEERRRRARRAASHRSSRPAPAAGSRWGRRRRCRGSSTRRPRAAAPAGRRCRRTTRCARRSVWTTTPVTSSGPSGPGWPSMPHVLEAVGGVAGLEHVARPTSATRRGRPDRRSAARGSGSRTGFRWSVVTSPSSSSTSPWTRVTSVPSGPRSVEADPAVDVLAEVDDVVA